MGGGRGRQDRSGEAVEGAARPLGSAPGGGRRWATTVRSAPGGGGRWAGGSGIGVEGMIHAASAPLTPAGCGFEGLLADRQVRRGPILTASATRGGPRPVFVPGGAQPQVASGGAGCGGRPSRSPSRGGSGRRRPPRRAPAGRSRGAAPPRSPRHGGARVPGAHGAGPRRGDLAAVARRGSPVRGMADRRSPASRAGEGMIRVAAGVGIAGVRGWAVRMPAAQGGRLSARPRSPGRRSRRPAASRSARRCPAPSARACGGAGARTSLRRRARSTPAGGRSSRRR